MVDEVLFRSCRNGKSDNRLVGILGIGIEQRGTFRAKSRRVGGILLICSCYDNSVAEKCGSTY